MTIIDNSLKGKTVVVTAGNRGLGEIVALRYAASGANIVILSNKDLTLATQGKTNSIAEKIIATGGNALTLEIDVADVYAIETAIEAIITRFHGVDILINISPPLDMDSAQEACKHHLLFSISKYGMSLGSAGSGLAD